MKNTSRGRSSKTTFMTAALLTALALGAGLTVSQFGSQSTDSRSQAAADYRPVVVALASTSWMPGVEQKIPISVGSMGVPVSRAEIGLRIITKPFPKSNFSIFGLNSGLQHVNHTFTRVRPVEDQEVIVYLESNSPQGFNRGSEPVPAFELAYTSVPGTVTVDILRDKTKFFGLKGEPLNFDLYGGYTYTAVNFPSPTPIGQPRVSPTPVPYESPFPRVTPTPSPKPGDQAEIEMMNQRIAELDAQVQAQNKEIQETKSVLQKVTDFLKKLFRF